MKEKLKKIVTMVKEKGMNGLEKARSSGTAKKVVTVVGAFLTVVIVLIVCVKALSYLMASVYNFVDTHFFGVAASAAGISYLVLQHNEKMAKQKKFEAEKQAGLDNQRQRFVKGCYKRVGQFLFTNIFTASNFQDLTSCLRPYRPQDMGNETLDAYTLNGVMYLRFNIPKATNELLDTNLIRSVIQGLCDEKIRTGGLSPLISAGKNQYLYVDKVEDMVISVALIFVLDFDDTYIQQVAYQQAMNDVIARENSERSLRDNDYD